MPKPTTTADADVVADVDAIAGLIKELIAYMSGQTSIDDATGLDACGVDHRLVHHVLFGIHQSFGVQVPPSEIPADVRSVGQLARTLGVFVEGALRARASLSSNPPATAALEPAAEQRRAEPRAVVPRRVLLVGPAGVPEFEQAIARRGWHATAFTHYDLALDTAVPVGVTGVIDQVEAVDWAQPLDVVRRIVDLHGTAQIHAVVAVNEFGLLPAALATTQVGLPGTSLRAVRNTRDKLCMRRALEQAGLGQVPYAACRTLAEAQEFLDRVGRPIIVKPVSGTGSEGVSLVASAEELAAAVDVAAAAVGFSGLLCEEYIDGPEVSLEGYSVDGHFVPVALTDKLTNERFLEVGHQQPSVQPPDVFEAAADTVGRALAALGVRNGVTHSELRIGASGPVLIETHTRMGGDYIHVLTQLTTGVDLVDLMVAFSLGEHVGVRPTPQGRAAAVRFLVGRPGRVSAVRVPAMRPDQDVHAFQAASIGKALTGRSASRQRLGHVITTGPTPECAGRTAESVIAGFRVEYFDPRDPRGIVAEARLGANP